MHSADVGQRRHWWNALGWLALRILMFFPELTDELFLQLDMLQVYNAGTQAVNVSIRDDGIMKPNRSPPS
jgi:hypothetical protein